MLRILLGASILTIAACSSTPSTTKTGSEDPVDDCAANPEACDEDGDGFRPSEGDCDDADAGVNPASAEACNGKDEDCDGEIDEGVTQTWYADLDQDGFGDPSSATAACEAPAGYIPNGTDCNDASAAAFPGADEVCDGVDNDCDGTVDDGVTGTYYADADGDGFGDPASGTVACEQPVGHVTDNTDCDDRVSAAFPGNVELCDEVDNNCDGTVDEGVTTRYYADVDADGYGNAALPQDACSVPTGYAVDGTDCDDNTSAVNPGVAEVCNTVDDDCDGTVDEPDATDARTWYADTDGDSYGNGATAVVACESPAGHVLDGTDCNDAQAASFPGNAEVCDEVDNDCDAAVDEDVTTAYYVDADADGFGNPATRLDACAMPSGYATDNTDCDDARASSNPAATEYCNSFDDDCDGTVDEADAADAVTWYNDADRDGYGDASSATVSCTAPSGYITENTDCLDTSAVSYPGATEICDGLDNDCDGTVDDTPADGTTYYADADGDGYGDPDSTVSECAMPAGYSDNVYDCDDTAPGEPRVADVVVGSSLGDGSLSNPFDTVQAAIDAANSCVIVYPGTYSETVDLSGKSIDVWGIEGARATTIDGNAPTCSAASPAGCETAVTIASGSGAAPTLRGLTITGGSGHSTSATTSTTCADSSASSTGANTCTVTTYDICGGGVYVDGDDPIFEDVIIRDNLLPDFARVSVGDFRQNWMYSYGGGLCVHDGNVAFSESLFEGNEADQGGAIYADEGSYVTFEQGLVSENVATDGAGVNLSNASVMFANAIVACNDAVTDGGGIFTETAGTSVFVNTVLYGNTSSVSGSSRGLNAYIGASTTFNLYSSIAEASAAAFSLWGAGSGAFDYNNVYNSVGGLYGGALAAGTGAVSAGFNFVSARCDGNAYNDNFRLTGSSAGVNAGDPSYTDVDGSRADMGAYGGAAGDWSL